MRIRTLTAVAAAALGLALAGCSAESHNTTDATPTPQATTAKPKPKPEPVPTAAQVVKKVVAKVPTARRGKVYTAATDPNDKLGRPGGYTSKAECQDTRYRSADWSCSVEVFKTEAQAKARKKYILSVERNMPMLGTEYMTVHGPVLLRLPDDLTPEQAAQYRQAAF